MKLTELLKNSLLIAAFGLFMFLSAEFALRVHMIGPSGLNPWMMNSYVIIFRSGLVKTADNIDVWYDLKPNQETLFRGVELRTNSRGLRDREYSLEKPPNTYRIAVVGSSWTMGAGVNIEDTYHSKLEQQLNAENPAVNIEFINFAVEFYTLGEILATIEHKVMPYDPDMILMAVTNNTAMMRVDKHTEPYVELEPHTGHRSVLMLRIRQMLGLADPDFEATEKRTFLQEDQLDDFYANMNNSATTLARFCELRSLECGVIWLKADDSNQSFSEKSFRASARKVNLESSFVVLSRGLQPGEQLESALYVNRVEPHPNQRAHAYIAEQIRQDIFGADFNPAPAD